MADCGDRIAVLTVERTLEPLRMMAEASAVSAITVRVHSIQRRFDLAIHKRWSRGAAQPPAYAWQLAEVQADGTPVQGGIRAAGTSALSDPEDAYWAAVEAVSEAAATPASPAPL